MTAVKWQRQAPRIWSNGVLSLPYVSIIFDYGGADPYRWRNMTREQMDTTGPWSIRIVLDPRRGWDERAIVGEPDTYPNVAEAKEAAEKWLRSRRAAGWVDPAFQDHQPRPRDHGADRRESAARTFASIEDPAELLDLMAFHKRSKKPYADDLHAAARAEVLARMERGR